SLVLFALLLLALACNGEHVVDNFNLDLVFVHARQVGMDEQLSIALVNVNTWRPRHPEFLGTMAKEPSTAIEEPWQSPRGFVAEIPEHPVHLIGEVTREFEPAVLELLHLIGRLTCNLFLLSRTVSGRRLGSFFDLGHGYPLS